MIKGKRFIKTVEDFTCQVCGFKVQGTGFTDHCPKCLWSKHVDISPGDRREKCGGLMEPVGAIRKGGKWRIFYHCQKCGYERFNNASADDNFQKIREFSSRPVRINRSKFQNVKGKNKIFLLL